MIETWNDVSLRHRRRAQRGWALILLITIATIAIACCGPRPCRGAEVKPAGPIAYVLCGGNGPPNEFPGTVRFKDYVDAAMTVGPQVQKAGLKRLLYHNPGGSFYLGWTPIPTNIHDPATFNLAKSKGVDVRDMWVNQWLLAEQATCPYANRKSLALGHQLLRDYYGVEEVIYYLGSPETLRDVAVEGPKCVEMFLACGKGASLAFDVTAWDWSRIKAGDETCKFFDALRKQGTRVYVEPRLNAAQVKDGVGAFVDGTIAMDSFDTTFKPDLSSQPGETIRGNFPPTTKPPAGVTLMVHDGVGFNWGAPK